MSKFPYNYRVQANFNFDWSKTNYPATDPRLAPFTELIWSGQDDEGWCVFKRNPATTEVLRIDFYPPIY